MSAVVNYTILDASGEKSGFRVYGPTLSSAIFDAQIAEISGLRAAIDAITLGTLSREQVVASNTIISSALPASPYAQREFKLLVNYVDDVTGLGYSLTIPCPDLAALTVVEGSDAVLLADADVMADFVSAFEGYAVSPVAAMNAVTITGARIVGRNL